MFRAKYITGSSCLLEHANDVDYVVFYDTNEERLEALKKNRERNTDIHFDCVENHRDVFLGCYIYPFMKLVEGEELDFIKNFSIFDVEQEYKSVLLRYCETLPLESKRWYHILTACYMFKNGKMKLTTKQLEKVQSVHDKGADKKVKDYCLKQLNTLD